MNSASDLAIDRRSKSDCNWALKECGWVRRLCFLNIEIDTLEYQQTEKIETEMKDVYRIRIRKVYVSCPGWPSGGSKELSIQTQIYAIPCRLHLPTNKWRSAMPGRSLYLLSTTGLAALGGHYTTVGPVQNFPPPCELLVCYQPHRQTAMPGQKSIYETFLFLNHRQGNRQGQPFFCRTKVIHIIEDIQNWCVLKFPVE